MARLASALAIPLAAVASLLSVQAYAADGAQLFQLQCKFCHQDKSSVAGPSLAAVSGRKIASLADFSYSPALKAKTGTWTDAHLDAFLTAPAKFAPGTRMPMSVAAAPDRAALVTYLKTLK